MIDIERQIGGADGALALEICATPSGDDPWPLIRFLVFGVAPFWEETASRIDRLGWRQRASRLAAWGLLRRRVLPRKR